MTYISVVAGVQGIWYWSWGNLNLPAPDGAPSSEIGYLDQVVNGLVPLEPVILSPDAHVHQSKFEQPSGLGPGEQWRFPVLSRPGG
jgi:hypothetical protein